jgi:hypothetical protein
MSTTSAHAATLPPDRRGRLKNGAAGGDFLAAPRCGARTRGGGSCRQPAMRNGRCRMHGGLSTGPRTAEGRARCARARLIHGGYSRATRALQEEARSLVRRLRGLRLGLRAGAATAGHGVLRSEVRSQRSESRNRRPGSRPVKTSPVGRPSAASTAGHGLLPRRASLRQRRLLNSTALSSHPLHPAVPTSGSCLLAFGPAWHGVLPPSAAGSAASPAGIA